MLRAMLCGVMDTNQPLRNQLDHHHTPLDERIRLRDNALHVAQDLRAAGEVGTALLLLDQVIEKHFWFIGNDSKVFEEMLALHKDFVITAEKIDRELDLGPALNFHKSLGFPCSVFDGIYWTKLMDNPERWRERPPPVYTGVLFKPPASTVINR